MDFWLRFLFTSVSIRFRFETKRRIGGTAIKARYSAFSRFRSWYFRATFMASWPLLRAIFTLLLNFKKFTNCFSRFFSANFHDRKQTRRRTNCVTAQFSSKFTLRYFFPFIFDAEVLWVISLAFHHMSFSTFETHCFLVVHFQEVIGFAFTGHGLLITSSQDSSIFVSSQLKKFNN